MKAWEKIWLAQLARMYTSGSNLVVQTWPAVSPSEGHSLENSEGGSYSSPQGSDRHFPEALEQRHSLSLLQVSHQDDENDASTYS